MASNNSICPRQCEEAALRRQRCLHDPDVDGGNYQLVASTLWLHVGSNDIVAGHAIPKVFMARQCGGETASLACLEWAPHGTASFAVVMHDADAPIPGVSTIGPL